MCGCLYIPRLSVCAVQRYQPFLSCIRFITERRLAKLIPMHTRYSYIVNIRSISVHMITYNCLKVNIFVKIRRIFCCAPAVILHIMSKNTEKCPFRELTAARSVLTAARAASYRSAGAEMQAEYRAPCGIRAPRFHAYVRRRAHSRAAPTR